MTDPRHELGLRAEAAVARWLAAAGWEVLEHRWRSAAGELDLVCRDPDGALVGVEVKLRTSGRTGTAAESVDRRRTARLRASLGAYGAATGIRSDGLRLDLVTVERATEGRWRLRRLPSIDGW